MGWNCFWWHILPTFTSDIFCLINLSCPKYFTENTFHYTAESKKKFHFIQARNLWFLFPLGLDLSLLSRHFFLVKTSLFEWNHHHISLKWWFVHPIPLFEQIKCHLMSFSWQLESKRTRARGKSNHKFRAPGFRYRCRQKQRKG